MANKVLWAAESEASLLTTELNNLAPTGLAIDGADYDNATNLFRYADFLLFLDDFDAAPTAGDYMSLHIFYKLDGTNYGDGEHGDVGTPAVSGSTLHGIFVLDATDGNQYIQLLGVPLRPFAFRACIAHDGTAGSDLTAVDTHFLKMYPYNDEIQ